MLIIHGVVDHIDTIVLNYKLKLKAYSKKRFDPFCRWDRITIPYNDNSQVVTTIGQLNFFKWALENKVIEYIELHYKEIELDMNSRNSTSKRKKQSNSIDNSTSLKSVKNYLFPQRKVLKKKI